LLNAQIFLILCQINLLIIAVLAKKVIYSIDGQLLASVILIKGIISMVLVVWIAQPLDQLTK